MPCQLSFIRPLAVGASLSFCALLPAFADQRSDWLQTAPQPFRDECGSCHVPFPPRLLNANDWRTVMAELEHHYGESVALSQAATQAITDYLIREAGDPRKVGNAPGNPPRLTQTSYFLKEHRKVSASLWQSSAVLSPANCGACHQGAERGLFDEHDVRLPQATKREDR
ncbi:diheme cytochrome c [Hydrogenophilus thiooxidans]|uniref:diheme cytochrome c n=1 Tax=Hydrogenophilus thiooxidans TaxID=2820326 RepID=UPI001C243306|nr:diheme cytochrome c [Hydrogenophilus thiooxidans]